MAVYPKMKPMLQFTNLPPPVEEKRRRRKKPVKTPSNPRVKALPLQGPGDQEDVENLPEACFKWVSPQFKWRGSQGSTDEGVVSDCDDVNDSTVHVNRVTRGPQGMRRVPLEVRKLSTRTRKGRERNKKWGQQANAGQRQSSKHTHDYTASQNLSKQPLEVDNQANKNNTQDESYLSSQDISLYPSTCMVSTRHRSRAQNIDNHLINDNSLEANIRCPQDDVSMTSEQGGHNEGVTPACSTHISNETSRISSSYNLSPCDQEVPDSQHQSFSSLDLQISLTTESSGRNDKTAPSNDITTSNNMPTETSSASAEAKCIDAPQPDDEHYMWSVHGSREDVSKENRTNAEDGFRSNLTSIDSTKMSHMSINTDVVDLSELVTNMSITDSARRSIQSHTAHQFNNQPGTIVEKNPANESQEQHPQGCKQSAASEVSDAFKPPSFSTPFRGKLSYDSFETSCNNEDVQPSLDDVCKQSIVHKSQSKPDSISQQAQPVFNRPCTPVPVLAYETPEHLWCSPVVNYTSRDTRTKEKIQFKLSDSSIYCVRVAESQAADGTRLQENCNENEPNVSVNTHEYKSAYSMMSVAEFSQFVKDDSFSHGDLSCNRVTSLNGFDSDETMLSVECLGTIPAGCMDGPVKNSGEQSLTQKRNGATSRSVSLANVDPDETRLSVECIEGFHMSRIVTHSDHDDCAEDMSILATETPEHLWSQHTHSRHNCTNNIKDCEREYSDLDSALTHLDDTHQISKDQHSQFLCIKSPSCSLYPRFSRSFKRDISVSVSSVSHLPPTFRKDNSSYYCDDGLSALETSFSEWTVFAQETPESMWQSPTMKVVDDTFA